MPLILMCGPPCSGKSSRTEDLKTKLLDKYGVSSNVVGEEIGCSGPFQRNVIFNSASMEKESRGHIRSEVQRLISQERDVIIVDSPNYIKGYRYELFCLSKANRSTYCVIHCDVNTETAWSWNSERSEEESQYTRATFDALVMRFECPDSRNRWDSPLFTLHSEDELPLDKLYDCLFKKKALPANQSTQSQPLLDTNFLYNLDKVTQDIVYCILEAQKSGGVGDEIVVPNASAKLRLNRKYTPTELARLKRQFMVYTKMHPVENGEKSANTFVRYLGSGSFD